MCLVRLTWTRLYVKIRASAALAPKGSGDEREQPSGSRFPNFRNESLAQPSTEPQLVRARFRRGSELI
jgi:hypothetical protein